MKGWDKTAAESRDGLGLACSAPCTGLSAGLASGFCAVSGPPHPAPRPSQPLPAASNATDIAGPTWLGSSMTSGHPERCQGGVGSERLVLCNRFFQWDPIPPIQKLVFWLEQHLETEILKSQIPASRSPWECDFYSPFSHLEEKEPAIGVLYPVVRRQHCELKGCVLSSLDGITFPLAPSEHKFSDISGGCGTWAFLTGWTYDLYSARE